MKNMKKLLVMLLTLAMVFSMSIASFASGSNSITISETGTAHTYHIYQLLSGTYDNGELKNIDWGTGVVKPTDNTTAATAFATVSSDSKVSVNLTNNTVTIVNGTGDAATSATYTLSSTYTTVTYDETNGYKATGLDDGYYVVVDVVSDALNDQDDAYSAGIVKVAGGNVEVAPKSATPTVDKLVKDEAADKDTASTDADGWGETADHSLYETYQYKLVATLPNDADFDEYEHYYLQFVDSISAGVTYAGNMTVTVNGNNVTDFVIGGDITSETTSKDGAANFTVTINDLLDKDLKDLKGATIVVTYDAYLNNAAAIGNVDTNKNTVELKYSNDTTYDGKGTPKTGKTGPDTVYTFTYEVDNVKVDGTTSAKLAGAQFKLYSDSACETEIGLIYDSTISAYRPVKSGETATAMVSADSTGVFNIKGVDAGTYYLKETQAPTGYNLLESAIEIVIKADHSETTTGAATTIDTATSKNMNNTVENFNGTTLPTTGGIGTTIFYALGTILVLGAGVVLVARKRIAR